MNQPPPGAPTPAAVDAEDEPAAKAGAAGDGDELPPLEDLLGPVGSDDDGDDDDFEYLPPDHPLIAKVQKKFKEQYENEIEKLRLDQNVKGSQLKSAKKTRLEISLELYDKQEQLAKMQKKLEELTDQNASLFQMRTKADTISSELQKKYGLARSELLEMHRSVEETQNELDELNSTIKQVGIFEDNIRAEKMVNKRTTSKAEESMTKLELEKKQQDILIDNLTQRIKYLNSREQLYTEEFERQSEETKQQQQLVVGATSEMEAIKFEQKQIMQQWKSSIVGMERRDVALKERQNSERLLTEQLMAMDTNIGSFRQRIDGELGKQETRVLLQKRLEMEYHNLNESLQRNQLEKEKATGEYGMLSKALQTEESDLYVLNAELDALKNDSKKQQQRYEQLISQTQQVEQDIFEQTQNRCISEKQSTRNSKAIQDLIRKIRETEGETAKLEYVMSTLRVQKEATICRIKQQREDLREALTALREKQAEVTDSEVSIRQRVLVMEKNQKEIDRVTRRRDELVSKYGRGEGGNDDEIQIRNLQRKISSLVTEANELQQYWLRGQQELIMLAKEESTMNEEIDNLCAQDTVLSQKTLRLNAEIEQQESEITLLQRAGKAVRNDMEKVNCVITRKNLKKEALSEEYLNMQHECAQQLKECELEATGMEESIVNMQSEKRRNMEALLEAERQTMLWEKKITLAKETFAALDPNVGADERKGMKKEIHRMQLRYQQLTKHQENLVQEMERAIERRESISIRGKSSAKSTVMTKSSLKKTINDLERKLNSLKNDCSTCDEDIQALISNQSELCGDIESQTKSTMAGRDSLTKTAVELERLVMQKQDNLKEISKWQQRIKWYESAMKGTYKIRTSPDRVDEAIQKALAVNTALRKGIDNLQSDYAHIANEVVQCVPRAGAWEN